MPLTDERLIKNLIDAAYDSGYYSGKKEDGSRHHLEAIDRRKKAKRDLLRRFAELRCYLPHGGY